MEVHYCTLNQLKLDNSVALTVNTSPAIATVKTRQSKTKHGDPWKGSLSRYTTIFLTKIVVGAQSKTKDKLRSERLWHIVYLFQDITTTLPS